MGIMNGSFKTYITLQLIDFYLHSAFNPRRFSNNLIFESTEKKLEYLVEN